MSTRRRFLRKAAPLGGGVPVRQLAEHRAAPQAATAVLRIPSAAPDPAHGRPADH